MRRPFDFIRLPPATAICAGVLALWGLCAALPADEQPAGGLTRMQALVRARALAALGRKLFSEPLLSGSGKMSCASCHDPAFAYGPPNDLSVQPGGVDLRRSGIRATPSLRYLQVIPQFTTHYFGSDEGGDDSIDNGPTGGLMWDGRVDRLREQASMPLLSPLEMANAGADSVVSAARKAGYGAELIRLAGSTETAAIYETILEALEAFQQDYKEFYPYSSKYDAWLAGAVKLSAQESRGLKLFTDPKKGDCARCHTATRGANGAPPQFTDYGYAALGVPRNRAIPANADASWYDLGLCGPERADLRGTSRYCGRFMTPTLRNIATRRAFFHNGVFHTLKDAVAFYAQRDTNPEKWYPKNREGTVLKFDDLPPRYRPNVEMGTPFGRLPGQAPALSDSEVNDIVAFLGTLTDDFRAGQSQGPVAAPR